MLFHIRLIESVPNFDLKSYILFIFVLDRFLGFVVWMYEFNYPVLVINLFFGCSIWFRFAGEISVCWIWRLFQRDSSLLMFYFDSLHQLPVNFSFIAPFVYSISYIFIPSDAFFICFFNCMRFRLKIWLCQWNLWFIRVSKLLGTLIEAFYSENLKREILGNKGFVYFFSPCGGGRVKNLWNGKPLLVCFFWGIALTFDSRDLELRAVECSGSCLFRADITDFWCKSWVVPTQV